RITATLPVSGEWGSRDGALACEKNSLAHQGALIALMGRERVDTARRAMLVIPRDLIWSCADDATLEMNFWLPAGIFATSLVRELLVTQS
ncbi:tRNA pseudouridine(13) synthase TruD, partial [Erwinia amylovora]|nr:tRNA pseudouridine(13) synthase TruD [Erwinia amylovora]